MGSDQGLRVKDQVHAEAQTFLSCLNQDLQDLRISRMFGICVKKVIILQSIDLKLPLILNIH